MSFDYSKIQTFTLRSKMQAAAKQIHNLNVSQAECVIRIGEKLNSLKGSVSALEFRDWVAAEFKWALRTASNYIRCADIFGSLDSEQLAFIQPSAMMMLSRKRVPVAVVNEALRMISRKELVSFSIAQVMLIESGVKPIRKDAGKLRKLNIGNFEASIHFFSSKFDEVSKELTKSKKRILANRLRQLADKLSPLQVN